MENGLSVSRFLCYRFFVEISYKIKKDLKEGPGKLVLTVSYYESKIFLTKYRKFTRMVLHLLYI